MSTFCTLIIVGVPFVRPMENVTTTAGKNFSIRCYVAGYPVSQVTWSKGELRYIYLLDLFFELTFFLPGKLSSVGVNFCCNADFL